MINLDLGKIKDDPTRNALESLQRSINGNDISSSTLKLIEINHSTAVTGESLYHNLGYIPTDIWITKQVGGTITWDWDNATTERIKYTTSGAVIIRLLIGRI